MATTTTKLGTSVSTDDTLSLHEEEDGYMVDPEEEALAHFKPIMSKEKGEREGYLDTIKTTLLNWSTRGDQKSRDLLASHLPTVLRLSLSCPFEDVRASLKTLLQTIDNEAVLVPRPVFEGPSSFMSVKDVAGYHESSKPVTHELQQLYENAFLRDARLSNIVQCLSDHPQYLDLFIQTMDFIMNGDGPLNQDVRCYIAILASSRHRCSYLVTYLEMEFRAKGGNVLWLKGISHIPTKISNLLILNKMLCHQPWYISQTHFQELLVGPDSWSVAELVHAVVIMAFFHALAGFCLGCGLNPEIDTELGHTVSDQSEIIPSHFTNPALGVGGTGSDSEPSSGAMSPACSPPNEQVSKYLVEHYIETSKLTDTKKLDDTIKEKLAAVSQEEDETEEIDNDRQFAESVSSFGLERIQSRSVPTPVSLFRYISDPGYEHEDFTLASAGTLRAREYSWEDHGFSFLNSLYPLLSELLDEKFKVASEMTYRHVGATKDIDTKPFREATWYYIQSIKGIRHDDYNYGKVNKVLSIDYKTYIRMVACFPEKVSLYDFRNCMDGLQFSEKYAAQHKTTGNILPAFDIPFNLLERNRKVHVNVLVMEARLQAELIYSLKALMSHMK